MKKSKIILIVVLAAVFSTVAFAGLTGFTAELEAQVQQMLNPSGRKNIILKFFTDIGEAPGVVTVILMLLLLPPTRKNIGAPIAVTVAFSAIITKIIKELVARERPVDRLLEVGGYSFPSGHAANNAALYIGIMLLALKIFKKQSQKIAVSVLCISAAFIIGVSRVYFNVHYLSDVICGWCLGGIIAAVFTELYFNLKNSRIKTEKKL